MATALHRPVLLRGMALSVCPEADGTPHYHHTARSWQRELGHNRGRRAVPQFLKEPSQVQRLQAPGQGGLSPPHPATTLGGDQHFWGPLTPDGTAAEGRGRLSQAKRPPPASQSPHRTSQGPQAMWPRDAVAWATARRTKCQGQPGSPGRGSGEPNTLTFHLTAHELGSGPSLYHHSPNTHSQLRASPAQAQRPCPALLGQNSHDLHGKRGRRTVYPTWPKTPHRRLPLPLPGGQLWAGTEAQEARAQPTVGGGGRSKRPGLTAPDPRPHCHGVGGTAPVQWELPSLPPPPLRPQGP